MSNLTKTEIVLNQKAQGGQFTDGKGKVGLVMDTLTWADMGHPTVITVAIEPGDTLNA
jgi:hypothetical protein